MRLGLFVLIMILGVFVKAQERNSNNRVKKWDLVWADEFDKDGRPDPSKWGYEIGYIRGTELQFYTNDPTNVFVRDGLLHLSAKKDFKRNPRYKPNHTWSDKYRGKPKESLPRYQQSMYDSIVPYSSASINTLGKMHFKRGKLVVRAKVPKGQGLWPAIWMLGANRMEVGWPKCGEIDVMEYAGKKSGVVTSNVHYANKKGEHIRGAKVKKKIALEDEFHEYVLIWEEKTMKFYIDNHLFGTTDISSSDAQQVFEKDFYLILNLALGGSMGGDVSDNLLPQTFLVDYVRYYR